MKVAVPNLPYCAFVTGIRPSCAQWWGLRGPFIEGFWPKASVGSGKLGPNLAALCSCSPYSLQIRYCNKPALRLRCGVVQTARSLILIWKLGHSNLCCTSALKPEATFHNHLVDSPLLLWQPGLSYAPQAEGGVLKCAFGDTASGSDSTDSETSLSGWRDSVSMPSNHSVAFRMQGCRTHQKFSSRMRGIGISCLLL